MKRKSNQNYLIKQVKQKFNRFGIKHCKCSKLLKQTRFNWGVERNTMNVTKEV